MHNIYLTTIGRLGNQMFQYATLRALSIEINATPIIVKGDEDYALGCFEMSDIIDFVQQPKKSVLNKIGIRFYNKYVDIFQSPQGKYSKENKWFFLLQLFGLYYYRSGYKLPYIWLLRNRNVLCYGYFQSEGYFKKHEEVIRKDFTFKEYVKKKCAPLAKEICATESVCVHVRRGDYLDLPEFQVCSDKYYYDAMNYILKNKPAARFYIFTDDFEYCTKQFGQNGVVVIPSYYSGEESMYLGTLCKNHIMSNSSFSWWMQYLAHSPYQIVIAPTKWYNSKYISDGIYQSNWVLL